MSSVTKNHNKDRMWSPPTLKTLSVRETYSGTRTRPDENVIAADNSAAFNGAQQDLSS